MSRKVLTFFGLLCCFISFWGHSDDIELGDPRVGGSGCPSGTTSVTLSPDAQELSILFDEYISEAGGETGKRIDRKTCNLTVPVHVPQGFSVSIIKVDYRGFAYIPRGGRGRFNVEYFFAGMRGPRARKTFRGGFDDDYFLTNNLTARTLVWSRCGDDVNLRINTSMFVKTNRNFDQAMATVDSVDINAGIVYKLQWRRCR